MHSRQHEDISASERFPRASRPRMLRRSLGLWLLVLYGLGVIIGAGIYVLVGAVVETTGNAAPISFIIAGLMAAATGLSYAELSSRFPEAAGATAYVKYAFGSDRLSQATGLAVAAAVAVSTASIARGSAAYAQTFVTLPESLIAGGLVVIFTAIGCLRVKLSVGAAALLTIVEIGGLLLVVAAGSPALLSLPDRAASMLPTDLAQWSAVAAGAFLAFFAFIGFENLVNMSEEAKDAQRTMPLAIILSIGLSTVLYTLVVGVTILAVPMEDLRTSTTPLLDVVSNVGWGGPRHLAAIALLAVSNGVLIELIMLARLLYGMASHGWLPARLAAVHPRTQTPVVATVTAGVIVLSLTLMLPFISLVAISSTITLLVFTLVNAALWRLHRTGRPEPGTFRAPRWLPPIAAAASLGLIVAQFAS